MVEFIGHYAVALDVLHLQLAQLFFQVPTFYQPRQSVTLPKNPLEDGALHNYYGTL